MQTSPYRVTVIVDPVFQGDLFALLEAGPIWVVDTPTNRLNAEKTWELRPVASHLDGITIFKSRLEISGEERLVAQMSTIDLHHGEYSADPPYTILHVIGAKVTPSIESELGEYGFDRFDPTSLGFVAQRQLPVEADEDKSTDSMKDQDR